MKPLVLLLAMSGMSATWAQLPQNSASPGQVADMQRRLELRRALQQQAAFGQGTPGHATPGQALQGPGTSAPLSPLGPQRQLNAQERAQLRDAVRQQRSLQGDSRYSGSKP